MPSSHPLRYLRSAITFGLLLTFIPVSFAQPEKKYTTKQLRKQFYEQLIKKIGTASTSEIFASDQDFAFEQYLDGHLEKNLIANYGTVIHELLHGYNNTVMQSHSYFIAPGVKISVPIEAHFNSKLLNTSVRKGLQDSIFRYQIYVGGKKGVANNAGKKIEFNTNKDNEIMSVSQGIYGLLEEFDAYYHGTMASYELYGYYAKNYDESNEEIWQSYANDLHGDLVAYYEFKLFIGWYLQYAQNKNKSVYEASMQNTNLRLAYTLVEQRYANLLQLAEKRINSIQKNLAKNAASELDFSGSTADFDRFVKLALANMGEGQLSEDDLKEIRTMLEPEYNKAVQEMKKAKVKSEDALLIFHALPEKQIALTQQQFTPELDKILKEFAIKGANLTNYKSFLSK